LADDYFPDYSSRGPETNGGIFFRDVTQDIFAKEKLFKVKVKKS
jgi:hypothetical protein